MHRANSFLDTHDVNSTAAAAGADAEAGQDVSADAEGAGDVEALKRELQELRSISQASQVIASCFALQCVASRCVVVLCSWGSSFRKVFFSYSVCVVSGEERDGPRAD